MTQLNVSAELSKENEDMAVAKINELEELLPFLIGLSTDARMALPKLGKKNLDFCDRTLIYGKDNDILITKFMNIEEMERDMKLLKQLQRILSLIEPLYEKIVDTYIELGAEVYSAGRVIYRTSKNAAQAGVPGMQVIVKDLAERYKKQFSKKDDSQANASKQKEQKKSLATGGKSSNPEEKAPIS